MGRHKSAGIVFIPDIPMDYNAQTERANNVIGKAIGEARRRKSLTTEALCTTLRNYGVFVTRSNLSKWENGMTVPTPYQLLAVCDALEIRSLAELRSSYREPLNSEALKKIQSYTEDLIASGRYRREDPAPEQKMVQMPVSYLAASAGTGQFLSEENFEMASFPASHVPAGADFALRIAGDSMEPLFYDGQLVWVQKTNRLTPGEIGIFVYDGAGYIKEYDEQLPPEEQAEAFTDSNGVLHAQAVLISLNKKYLPIVVSPELQFLIAGRVL